MKPGKQRLVLTGAAAALMLLVPLQSACGSNGATAVNSAVQVTIKGHRPGFLKTPGVILFTPNTVKRGTVTFKITNTDAEDHFFSINSATSADINGHGGKAILKVTFKRRGIYTGSIPDDETSGITGLLTVS